MNRTLLAVLLIALVWTGGCEQSTPPAPSLPQAPEDAQAVDGASASPVAPQPAQPPQRLTLTPLPLSLLVPADWKIDRTSTVNLLQGRTPNGEVHVLLNLKPAFFTGASSALTSQPIDWVAMQIEGARREQQADPKRYKTLKEWKLGDATVLERQIIDERPPLSAIENDESFSGAMRWTITVYAPQNGTIRTYELSFLGLSLEQFEKDQTFLEQIIQTLQYEPQAEIR